MKKSNLFLIVVCFLTVNLSLLTHNTFAQYTQLTDFSGNGAFTGSTPQFDQNLISVGGVLYGMTAYGGTNGQGTLFKIMPDGSDYVKLLDFSGVENGGYPYGSLVYDGTFLYGMTTYGGTNGKGTLFKIRADGTGFTKLFDFAGTVNGESPTGSLISDGIFLYGTTTRGGTNDKGTIFKIMPDGTGYVKLLDFDGAVNGGGSRGSLYKDGTFLYGMTALGGTNNLGTIFKIRTDGSGYIKLLDFDGAANGSYPYGSLISDGTFLYGMTKNGGTNNMGTLFKISTNGTSYGKLLDFSGASNGSYPYGSLISDGTFLYGMTREGGTNNMGTLFKINMDGTGYAKLIDFSGAANGGNPNGSLISDGTFLYGMTGGGGTSGTGTMFKIIPDGTGFAKLLDFSGAINGSNPQGSLISVGTFLYGMTKYGGTNYMGTLFKINTDGTGYGKLIDFAGGINGSYPTGSLISDGTFLYGMTSSGGTNNLGTLFKINMDGTGYAKLLDFAGASNGSNPQGSLILDGTFLYGMTGEGGTNDLGTIFKISTDGTGYLKLMDFAIANGVNPAGSLVFDGTFLYGMTGFGGSNSAGTIFKIMPNGTGYTKLLDFASGVNGGSNPAGSLISVGTFLYGTTSSGGINNMGTLFKINVDGNGYAKILDIASQINVSRPYGTLYSDGTFLYGTTSSGGIDGLLTLFKIMPDGTNFTKLLELAGAKTESNPQSSIISDGTFLYGMTYRGGSVKAGSVFKFCPPVSANASATYVCVGTIVTLTGSGTATSYSWSGGVTDGIGFIPSAGSTIYTVTGTGGNVCTNTASISIFVDACTGINQLTNNNEQEMVYPNPSGGIFTIESSTKTQEVIIVNILGESIYSSQLNTSKTEIDLSNQSEGVYFINLKTENGISTKKIIISK